MKMIFIGATLMIIYYMRYERVVRCTYDRDRDTFKSWIMVLASWLLAFLFHERIKGRGFMHYQVEVSSCLVQLPHGLVQDTATCAEAVQRIVDTTVR